MFECLWFGECICKYSERSSLVIVIILFVALLLNGKLFFIDGLLLFVMARLLKNKLILFRAWFNAFDIGLYLFDD
jgi:hypothetical protein